VRRGVVIVPGDVAGICLASDGPLDLPSQPDGPLPPVTILVPARNGAARIAACLGSRLRLDSPAFDVVAIWERLAGRLPDGCRLARVRLAKDATTSVEYSGEEVA
jgi:hypothetical protein